MIDPRSLIDPHSLLVDAARRCPPGGRVGEWSCERILAHVVLTDRLLTRTIADVVSGAEARYDNLAATRDADLGALVTSVSTREELIGLVEAAARELACAATAASGKADTLVNARIVDGDVTLVEGAAPLHRLVEGHARTHIPEHRRALDGARR